MDLYRLTIQDSQDSMQFDLLDAPIKIEDVEGAVDNTVLTGDIFTDYLFLKKRWEQKWAIMCKDEYERLRGFYTRQWSLATVPSVKVTQGYLEDTSWEGQVFYINTPYGGEIDSMSRMNGDASQETHTGKNLFDYTIETSPTTRKGLTITEDTDGTITVTGVPTENYVVISGGGSRTDITSLLEDGETYTISKDSTSRYTFIEVRGQKIGGGYIYYNTTVQTETSFTVNFSNCSSYDIAILSATTSVWGSSTRTISQKFMLEKGASATQFEKYYGGQETPNPNYAQAIRTVTGEQTISINGTDFKINLGKNLFDKDNASENSLYVGATGTLTSAGNVVTVYIPCQPNTTYTVSKLATGSAPRFCIYDTELEPLAGIKAIHSIGVRGSANTATEYTFTTSDRAHWLSIYCYNKTDTVLTKEEVLASLQVEAGNDKTDYASYITPIKLVSLVDAQDSIYYNGSDWILRKECAKYLFETASGSGTAYEGARHRMYFSSVYQSAHGIAFKAQSDTSKPAPILYENGRSVSFDDLYSNGKNGIALSSTTTLSIRDNSWTDATTAQNAIVGTTMYYALATPTETTITDATLIAQLNAIQAALQEGQNTVAVTANGSNLPAKTITLNGIAGREKPVLAQTNVRIGLSDGGVLNACECRQNVTLSMRETA